MFIRQLLINTTMCINRQTVQSAIGCQTCIHRACINKTPSLVPKLLIMNLENRLGLQYGGSASSLSQLVWLGIHGIWCMPYDVGVGKSKRSTEANNALPPPEPPSHTTPAYRMTVHHGRSLCWLEVAIIVWHPIPDMITQNDVNVHSK